MQQQRWEKAAGYEVRVSKGFMTLEDSGCAIAAAGGIRDFRQTLEDKQEIRNLLFAGFRRCLYPAQKFDSDTERRFARQDGRQTGLGAPHDGLTHIPSPLLL